MNNESRVFMHDGGGSSQSVVVRHGKGFFGPYSETEKKGLLVERTVCQHEGSNVLPRNTAYNKRPLTQFEFEVCQRNCGDCYKK